MRAGNPRAALPHDGGSTADLHPGLLGWPESDLCFAPPAAAPLVAAYLPAGQPGGRAFPQGRDRRFIPLSRQSGNHAAQDFTQSLGSVAPSIIGVRHAHSMEKHNDRVVAAAYVKARS